MSDLRIVAAACMRNGLIYSLPPPARHGSIMAKLPFHVLPDEQGFILSDGRFAERAEAYEIALAAGQMVRRDFAHYDGKYLFSEDMW